MFHLGPYHSTFGGGMGDFRKKMSCRLIFEGKNSCKEIPAKKIPIMKKISFKAYKAGKKILHRCMPGKNSITRFWGNLFFTQAKSPIPPPTPLKSQMVSPLSIFLYS